MDNNKKIIKLTFDQYLNCIYNLKLINSLIFSSNIDRSINKVINNESFSYFKILEFLSVYLPIYQEYNIFDDHIKNNLYFLINYFAENDLKTDKYKKTNMLNSLKILLNNINNNNYDFIRKQILLRDFGNLNYNKNLKKINNITTDVLDKYKYIYYSSIENDYATLNYLMINKDIFYNEFYKEVFLSKNFYRSINSFLNDNYILFCNETDFLSKVNFSLDKIGEFIINGSDFDISQANFDEEFFDIVNVTEKLVKKINY